MNFRTALPMVVIGLALPQPARAADSLSDNSAKLIELATKRFGGLTEPERKLFAAAAQGELADYTAGVPDDNDPSRATEWGDERALNADRVAWLCSDPQAQQIVAPLGLSVRGARLEGPLDLSFAKVPYPVALDRCAVPSGIRMQCAEIASFAMLGTSSGPIAADLVNVAGVVFFCNGFKATGEVSFRWATIRGAFLCAQSTFTNKGAKALDCSRAHLSTDIIFAQDCKLEGDVSFAGASIQGSLRLGEGFSVEGETCLVGASLGGQLLCRGGRFTNHSGPSINAEKLQVDGDVFLSDGFTAQGAVNLSGAVVEGHLDCGDASFTNTQGYALVGDHMRIRDHVFLTGTFKADGGVRLMDGMIGGQLNCSGGRFINTSGTALNAARLEVGAGVFLSDGFVAEGEVDLDLASIRGTLSCDNGTFGNASPGAFALTAQEMRTDGSVSLSGGFTAKGTVSLGGSWIGGELVCTGATLSAPGAVALLAAGLNVQQSVRLDDGFEAHGEVNFAGATIGGQVVCANAKFHNPAASALVFEQTTIRRSLFLSDRFRSEGEVSLSGSTIHGQLGCRNAEFINPGRIALNAEHLKILGGGMICQHLSVRGAVDLTGAAIERHLVWADVASPDAFSLHLSNATAGSLLDDRQSWPGVGSLFLDGFIYGDLHRDSPHDVRSRIEWLRRQPRVPFSPQPYEQLAAVLSHEGRYNDAKKILIAKEDDRARFAPMAFFPKCLHRFSRLLLGYGYQPAKMLPFMIAFVAAGFFVFRKAFGDGVLSSPAQSRIKGTTPPNGTDPDSTPKFSAFLYSLEAFIPLVNLHQVAHWLPNATRGRQLFRIAKFTPHSGRLTRFWLPFHILCGWILTTLFVAALVGLLRG